MTPAEPIWLERVVLDAIHLDQLREHGGLQGIRDENILESALARARNKWTYDESGKQKVHGTFRRRRRGSIGVSVEPSRCRMAA